MIDSNDTTSLLASVEALKQENARLRSELAESQANELTRFGELQVMAKSLAIVSSHLAEAEASEAGLRDENEILKSTDALADAYETVDAWKGTALSFKRENKRLKLRLLVKRAECAAIRLQQEVSDTDGWRTVPRNTTAWHRLERVNAVLAAARAELAKETP